jgi:DNA-binding NtrC family response regulator
MSAQLSSTASIGCPEKETTKLSPWLQDPNFSRANPNRSASQSNGGMEVMSVGDCSKTLNPHPTAYLQSIRLLVVDKSDDLRQMCCEVAESLGFAVMVAETVSAARKILKQKDTAILMLDLTEGEGEGQSLLTEMKSLCPNTLSIGISAAATIASAVETMRAGAYDYLSKPFPTHVLTEVFERASRRLCFDMERRNIQAAATRSGMADVLGQSVEMEDLFRILSNVARSTNSVMIVGENGSGKELVARSIHSNGPDASRPFVSVDCKSMSPNLLEAELFGELMGTSGEAAAQGRGLLASLEGGTIFLDEIDGLTPDLQGRLLRTLKEKTIWQEGGIRMHRISVRILAATSHDLVQMISGGRFRLDLYRLLSVVNLKIPPLRGRPGDIVLLAERFLERIGHCSGTARTLSQEALRTLKIYDWPGNTQELENAITHAFAVSSGPKLEINHLPQNILAFSRKRDADRKLDSPSLGKPKENVVTIATMEKRAIAKAIQQTNGDKRMAAQLLGIGKTTLYRKLKEYSVEPQPNASLASS